MIVELTVTELSALSQLIHFAVQARGMEVAETAVVLVKKLQAAAAQKPPSGDQANGKLRPPLE